MTDATQDIEKLAAEIQKEQESQTYGIKTDQLVVYIQNGKYTWNFADGNPRAIRMKLAKHMDKLKITLDKLEKSDRPDVAVAKIKADEEACKYTLETALHKFDYDEMLDQHAVDPFELSYLANEVFHFLVVAGGRAGVQRLRTLQKLDTLSRLTISQDSEKSGESSSSGKTD